jgi:hypothetical protein
MWLYVRRLLSPGNMISMTLFRQGVLGGVRLRVVMDHLGRGALMTLSCLHGTAYDNLSLRYLRRVLDSSTPRGLSPLCALYSRARVPRSVVGRSISDLVPLKKLGNHHTDFSVLSKGSSSIVDRQSCRR